MMRWLLRLTVLAVVVRLVGAERLYDVRFSYSPRQFAAFVAATPFASAGFSYAPLRAGQLPLALYARYALRRPAAA